MVKGMVKLFNEDCFKVMEQLDPQSIDVIITSPPYNIGTEYNSYQDKKPYDEYLAWIEEWSVKAKRLLTPAGSLFLNMGTKPTQPWLSADVSQRLRNHFVLQNSIIWVKSLALSEQENCGHVKPINSKRFLSNCWENLYHFTQDGRVELDRLAIGTKYKDKSNIQRWSSKQDKRCRGDVFYIPYKTINNKKERAHPATFPEDLPSMCIKLHGVERVKVAADFFMGVGTVGVAASKLGLDFIGCEIDKNYYLEAEKKINLVL